MNLAAYRNVFGWLVVAVAVLAWLPGPRGLQAAESGPDKPGYWVDGGGTPYTQDNERCWRNSNWTEADYIGTCEGDQDEDRVPDALDQCPDTPAGVAVDARGCPRDSDGDGVVDGQDICPDTPPGVVVGEFGCLLDSDYDGVADNRDDCPDTPPDTPVDARGCPEAVSGGMDSARQTETVGLALSFPKPRFAFDSARLSSAAREKLEQSFAQMQAHPETRFEIAGHTDSIGSSAYNQRLSVRRAEAAKAYLIRRGIVAERLVVKGYGESQPITENDTAAGRAKNRRIEIEILK